MNSATGSGSKPAPNLTVIVSGIILLYSLLLFPICPSSNLAVAIALEIGCFLLIAVPMPTSKGLPWFAWPQRAQDWLCAKVPILSKVRSEWRKLSALLAFALVFGAAVDLAAVWMAATGFTQGAVSLYSALPISYLLGADPAFSLEMLTGACVEAHQYDQAEGLYKAVLAVRKNVYGPNHPKVAALYADLGDLKRKMNDMEGAEQWYKASIAVNEGQGRAAHRLANLLRDEGNSSESEPFYKRALSLRARFFGVRSSKYQQTYHDYVASLSKDNLKKTQ